MKPIFQMTFEWDVEGNLGLVFTEEKEYYSEPIYALPFEREKENTEEEIFFLGEINGKFKKFIVRDFDKIFIVKDEELENPIRFSTIFAGIGFPFFYPSPFIYKYIGNRKEFVGPYKEFICLYPEDLLLMENEYKNNKTYFVGLTPTYSKNFNNLEWPV